MYLTNQSRKSKSHLCKLGEFVRQKVDAIPGVAHWCFDNTHMQAWRFGVQWRKRSLGTASAKGNRWVEHILSLKETCRLHARSTYQVLADAVASLFTNQQPDLTWIAQS
jgi:hypothetical protein